MTDIGQDFTKITDEDLLKRMWQETQDFGRKKEIRTHMYKLREERLRNLYDMDATGANYGVSKTSSHGDLVADHSFASLKAKEVRDSESPTRDNRGGIIRPAAGEWNVISSTETSADGREAKHHSLATTGGVKNVTGGKKTFAGLEEETAHRRVEGDDKNFRSTEGESSKTQLSEHTVTGNERDGKVEKFSKSFQTSSSSITRSGKTITNDFDSPDFAPVQQRSVQENVCKHDNRQSVSNNKQTTRTESINRENTHREQQQQQQDLRKSNQYSTTTTSTSSITRDDRQQTQQTHDDLQNIRGQHLQTTRNPDRVVEAFRLAEKPGQVVARTVIHTKPDTVCITETKVLTDGTKVTTKRYERVSTSSDIQTLRKQFNAIDTSNTTTRTSTDKRFTDEMTTQQKNLRKTDTDNSVQKIQINQEESSTVTKSKIIKSDGTEIHVTPDGRPIDVGGANVTRVERTEHRETLTQIPGELPPDAKEIVIEERFVTHYDNKDNVRRDSYTKTEVTEKVVDEEQQHTTHQQQRTPVKPVETARDTRISVEIDKTHQAWASSLRCLTPPPEGGHQPNYQSPSKRHSRHSPSRDSDVTKISNTTITKSTQYIPTKKTVTTEYRTHVQSPDRRPITRGGRPQRPGTDSESEDQMQRTTRRTSNDRTDTVRETSKFIRNETVTDNQARKPKPVLKRTETYEDRCRLLIGMPEKPVAPTNRQRSEDNLSPRKPLKGVHPVDDDTDTTRQSSFTKATSDITFDKKTLRTAQVTVDKNAPKKPTYKTELKRTISPVDETPDEPNSTKPSNKSRITTHETETIKVTRSNDKPSYDKKRPGRRPDEYTSTTEDEEYSSTLKTRTQKQTTTSLNETDKPLGRPKQPSDTPVKKDSTTYRTTETIEITKTVDGPEKKPLKKGPKLQTDTEEEVTEQEETIERRTSSYTDDTISSTLKKVDTTFEYHPFDTDAPSQDHQSNKPHDTQKPVDDFISNEKLHSTTITDTVTKTRPKDSQPRDKSPYTGSKPTDDRFTKYQTETVTITRTADTDQTPVGKKPLKKGPKLETDTEEEVTEHEETTEHRTSTYTDDTISSTLKKVDTTFEYHPFDTDAPSQDHPSKKPHDKQKPVDDFISNERLYTSKVTTEIDTTSKTSHHPTSQARDKSPYTGSKSDKFTKYEETVKITRTIDDENDHKSGGKKPVLKKGPKLETTDTEEEVVTEHEDSIHHRASSYTDDTISSTLKRVDVTMDYTPTKDRPHDLQTTHDDFVTRERHHTDNVSHVVKKDKPKGVNDQPDHKRPVSYTTEKVEEHDDYERTVSTSYLDDTVSSNLKKVHPDDIEDTHRSRSRSRDLSPTAPSYETTTRITKTFDNDVKILRDTNKTPVQKRKPKSKKPVDSDSDDDEEVIVVEQYTVDTTTGKTYDDDTVSSLLKKVNPGPIREKSPRRVVETITDEETDIKHVTSKTVTNKKVTEIKQNFEESKVESPKKPYESPRSSTKFTKSEKVTDVPSKKPSEISKITSTYDNRTNEFISNEASIIKSSSKPTPKKPLNDNAKFIKTEERFTSSSTVRQSTPVAPTNKKQTPKEKDEKPRRGSIVEITIDVKEDTLDDKGRPLNKSSPRPSRPHDKKGVTKTKTVTTTVRKEVDDSDEPYSSSDGRRPKRPTEKRLSDDVIRRKVITETITIKKDVVSDSDDTTVRKKIKDDVKPTVSSKTPTKTKPVKLSEVDAPKTPVGKHQKKCITTKTINLTAKNINSESLQENIVIDIQKAKSSREPSPNKLIPVPVSPDDEHVKTLPHRYPDKVVEPDDVKPKKKPVVKNIPIFEEQTNDFVGIKIEEVDDSHIDIRETSTNYTHTEASSDDDVATLSVSQKVNRFITEAEKLKSPSPSRTTKFDRDVNFDRKREKFLSEKIIEEASESETEVITRKTETFEKDRCFLDKKPKKSFDSSPVFTRKFDSSDNARNSREQSPSISLKSTEVVQNITKKTTEKFESKDFERPVMRQQSPGVSLKSTEAVKKAKAIFETKATPSPGTIPSKPRDIVNKPVFGSKSKTPVDEEEFEKKNITLVEAYEEKIVPRTAYKTYKKEPTPERQNSRSRLEDEIIRVRDSEELISASRPYSKTPEREPAKTTGGLKEEHHYTEVHNYQSSSDRYSSDRRSTSSAKSPRRPSNEHTPRNTRPSYDDSPQKKTPTRRDSGGNPPYNPNRRYSSETPPYMKDVVSNKKDIFEKKITTTNTETFERRKSMSPQVEDLEKPLYNTKGHTNKVEYERSSSREVPSYMSPTVSSLVHSNRKFSIETQVKQVQNVVEEDEHVEGIVLKNKRPPYQRTPTKEVPRKVSITDATIEDIFDLDVLERMLEAVVGYEQRRRIRAQIRLVKKLITEGKVTTDGNVSTKLTTKTSTTTKRQSSEHTVPQTQDFEVLESYHTVRNVSPASTKRTTTTTIEEYRSKNNEQPKLVKKETSTTVSGAGYKRPGAQKTPTKQMTKQQEQRTRTTRKEEYGVTPDFEDGLPLFGLKALRKKDGPSFVQSKVTGTTVTEKRYSENGKAPIGERKVTHYSTDPHDLEKLLDKESRTPSEIREKLFERQNSRSKGISSVTMVEKFGEDVEPDQRAILDNVSEPSTVATNTSRVSRKSVDALKQKFSSVEQSSSVTETTTSHYPKAGLILRSHGQSSRSSTPGASSFRSGSVDFDESDIEIRSLTRKTSREKISSSRQHISHDPFEDEEKATTSVKRVTNRVKTSSDGKAESFLDSDTKVTDIQDLLARMKSLDNAPRKAGETSEDQEARALLNRFLGASVIMSGAETILSDSGDSGIANQKVTTKTSTSTRTYSSVHPASGHKAIDTDNINDEETLRQLIESSTSYDERRILRARLRQLMADKESVKMERQESVTSSDAKVSEVIDKVAGTAISDEKENEIEASLTASDGATAGGSNKNITKKEESSAVTTHKTLGNESTMSKAVSSTKTFSSSSISKNTSATTAFRTSSNSSLSKFTSSTTTNKTSTSATPAVAAVTPRGDSVIQKILLWAQIKTRGYENVKIENFSSSWQDGMAFCALIHHFYPEAFDYSKLNPKNRRGNFTLAFRVAEDKAGIAPLLDVDDMVMMKKPDWKCVFTYVQSMHRHLRDKSI